MANTDILSDENTQPSDDARRSVPRRVAKWLAILVIGIVALIAFLLVALNTGPGKRFIVEQIVNYKMENGVSIDIGRLRGSIYGEMFIDDLKVSDHKGVFLTSPELRMNWKPFALLSNYVNIRELGAAKVRLMRLPDLLPTEKDPNAPFLPEIDIDIGKLDIGEMIIDPPVTGQKHVATLSGRVHIANRRAQVFADAATLSRPGIAGGDTLKLALDAVPDDNVLSLNARVKGPTGGLIATMAGLTQPIDMSLKGAGDWKAWNGKLLASLGTDKLADVALTARNGTFGIKGSSAPGLMFEGPTQQLLSPALAIDATIAFNDQLADSRIRLASDALRVAADGKIDFAKSSFDNMAVDLQILQPTAIAENLVGNGVNAVLKLDGAFSKPVVDYNLTAAMLGFGDTRLQRFAAQGVARIDTDRILIPVSARVARITGLNEAVGGLLTNVTLNGDIAIEGPRILSDNIVVRSDRLNAKAIVLADLDKGIYTGAVNGRVNDYRIESVGIFNLQTDIDLKAQANGGYALVGKVSARSSQLFNDGVRNFLGGNTLITSNVAYGSDGTARISNLRVGAPSFRLTGGNGSYTSNGGIRFSANAYSDQYGPLGVRASGTIAEPVAFVTAARPGVGIGLVNLEAAIRGGARGYNIQASGGTNYGPFDAKVLVESGGGPLAIDIDRLLFAGVNFDGRVVQTGAGPFAGKLNAAGQGISGTINLSNQNAFQRADFSARANGARIPGDYNIQVGRAIIDGNIVLFDTPQVIADAQLANVNYGDMSINAARAKVNYRGGSGTAKVLAEGYSGVPFRVAANAALTPQLWRVALDGRANSIDFKTNGAAQIVPLKNGYRLRPARIDFSKGSVRLAGTFADSIKVQSRLDKLDLSLVNTVIPGLGLNGSATGSLDFNQTNSNAFPSADARITVNNFTRTSLSAISKPVDISFVGRLLTDGGDARALIRRNGTVIGRMQASLSPLPPGRGSWVTRLLGAPLSGGIRYNGPADVLFSLAALKDQKLSGPIGVAADFSGQVQSPVLNGVIRANNLTYENEAFGTRLTNMKINGNFASDRLEIDQLTANAGNGTVSATGRIGFSAAQGFPMQINVKMDNARLARSDDLSATATGNLSVVNNAQGGLISGTIELPETRYKFSYPGGSEVAQLTGIRRKPPAGRQRVTGDRQPAAAAPVPSNWKLDLAVKADNRIFISGLGLESEWGTDLKIRGTTANPQIVGTVTAIRGNYSFSGRRFTLDEGLIRFVGGNAFNPEIDLSATADIDNVTAILNVTGSAQKPQIAFTSQPALPQDEIISRILFGSSVQNLSAIQAIQLASSLNSLRGGSGGLNPLGKLQSATGFDSINILGADKNTGRGTALAVGKYLTDDIYLQVITDSKGFTATQIEIALSRSLSILSQAGSFGETNVNLRYSKDY